MSKPVTRLRDMEIDEVSVVDKGAAQDGIIAIAKSASQEGDMDKWFAEDGSPVDESTLEVGDIVFNADGDAYEFVAEEPEAEVVDEAPEMELVGKSFSDEIREELSKAFGGNSGAATAAQAEVIAKAAAQIDSLRQELTQAQTIAKAERDQRMTAEYVSKAESYNLPGNPNELGPVLYRMAEVMSYEDCSIINKALTAAGETIFQEIGYVGGADNEDVMSMVSKAATEQNLSVVDVLDANPDAYAEYLRASGK